MICLEPEHQVFSPFSSVGPKHHADYRLVTDKNLLTEFFKNIKVSTLVVSAYNSYLFPEAVLDNRNLKIVNFHNSLLPRHRGRNAPTWAIYEQDEVTGITWHNITKKLDSGDIIAQKTIPISSQMTALELTLRSLEVGAEVFSRIIGPLIRNEHTMISQTDSAMEKPHRANEVPNGGILDLSWTVKKISAFLRSLDYGKFKIFSDPRINVLGSQHSVAGYRVGCNSSGSGSSVSLAEKFLTIRGEGLEIVITLR